VAPDLASATQPYFWFASQFSKLSSGSAISGTQIGRNAFTASNVP